MNDYISKNLDCELSDEMDKLQINNTWEHFVKIICDSVSKYVPLVYNNILLNKKFKIKLPKHILTLIKTKNKLWKKNCYAEIRKFSLSLKK